MTENELRINGKSFDETISQLEEFMESDDVHGELFIVLRSARDFMENLNEEIQQYRATGTVEGYELAIQSSIENYNLYREYKAKVQDFEAIGTIEELKALKEYKAKMEMQYLDDINNPLEPLKLSSALQSEIFKYNYRKEHKPQDINPLDYTIMYALKHCLEEQTEETKET